MKNISKNILLILIICWELTAVAQKTTNELTKHFTTEDQVARVCRDIEVTSNGTIMIATIYGINYFNGCSWNSNLLIDTLMPAKFTRLKRDHKNTNQYYVGGFGKGGMFVLRNDEFQFKEIIDLQENKEKLGGRLLKIYQKDDLIFFLGSSSGCIVYNQQTGQKSYISPVNNITSFSYLKMNQGIFITSSTGDLFKLTGKKWVKLLTPPDLIQQYQPIFFEALEDNLSVLVSNEQKFYLKTKDSNIREVPQVSALIKDGVKFQVKKRKDYLVILTNEQLLKFSLVNNEIGFQYKFKQLAANNFAFDLQGNAWVTTNNGVLYIELNEKFTFQPNNKGVRQSKLLGKYEVNLLKSENMLEINNGRTSKTIKYDGFVYDIILDQGHFLVSTSKGFYKGSVKSNFHEKLLKGKFRGILSYKPKHVYLLAGTQTLQILNKGYEVINTMNLSDGGVYNIFISTDGVVYYSTVNEVYQIKFSPDFRSILSKRKLKFPAKTRYGFSFFEETNNIYIVNALGLFKVDNHKKITCLTSNLKALPLKEEGVYYQRFSFAKPLANNRFFLTPVYSGGDGAKSFPGILSKDQSGQYAFDTKDFKRIGRIVTTDVKKLDSSHIQIIAQKKIITCNLNIASTPINKFSSYIREASLKKNISGSIKDDLRENNYKDSTIYQGITQQYKAEEIPYSTNSITFKFASDCYVATEYRFQQSHLVHHPYLGYFSVDFYAGLKFCGYSICSS